MNSKDLEPRRGRAVLAAAAALLLLAGCRGGGQGTVGPLGETAGSAGSAPAAAAGVVGATDGARLAGFGTRRIRFQQFDVTVLDAVTSRTTSATFANPSATPEQGETTYLYVKAKVVNTLKYQSYGLDSQSTQLETGTGQLVPFELALGDLSGNIQGGGAAEGWLAFPLPSAAVPASPRLVLGRTGYQQEILPLAGDVPAPAFPRSVKIDSSLRFGVDAGGAPTRVTLRITGATLSNAVAFDDQGSSMLVEQVLSGHRLLRLDFTYAVSSESELQISPAGFTRLVVNGELRSADPALISGNLTLSRGMTGHGYLVWDLPTTSDVVLLWGGPAPGDQVRTPIAMS